MSDDTDAALAQAAAIEADYRQRGLTIASGWESWWYLQMCAGMPPEWRAAFEDCWFTASIHLFQAAAQTMSGQGEGNQADVQYVANLMAEMESFRQRLTRASQS